MLTLPPWTVLRFLAVRRCAILATISIAYFLGGEKPSRSESISAALVTLGAFVAAFETIETDLLGFVLTWANNISQSMQNIYIAKLNERNIITPFGKSQQPPSSSSPLTDMVCVRAQKLTSTSQAWACSC